MSHVSQIPSQCISKSVTRPAVSKSHNAHRDMLTILHSGHTRKLRPAMPMRRAEAPRSQQTWWSPHVTSGLTHPVCTGPELVFVVARGVDEPVTHPVTE